MPNVIGFDIETSCEATTDLSGTHIICAALWSSERGAATVTYGEPLEEGGMHALQIEKFGAVALVNLLLERWHLGDIIVTWNGTGFDWPILAQESGLFDDCRSLALHSIDPAFLMLCTKGFMIGLDAAAKGADLGGKLGGLSGAMAPILWRKSLEEQKRVLKYVAQDARLTGQVYLKAIQETYLGWTAGSGKKNVWSPPMHGDRMMTVEEALSLPLPDTSWMTNPRTRESCIAWMVPKVETPPERFEEDGNAPIVMIETDCSELDGDVLKLDIVHSKAARLAAWVYTAQVTQTNLELCERINQRLRTLA